MTIEACFDAVISVSSAAEVIGALNSEGPYIDLILTVVDLPIDTSMKMLKYIMQDKDFHHILVISKLVNLFFSTIYVGSWKKQRKYIYIFFPFSIFL